MLVRLNGRILTEFLSMEETLDGAGAWLWVCVRDGRAKKRGPQAEVPAALPRLAPLPAPRCAHRRPPPALLLPPTSIAVGGAVHVEVERGGQPLAADVRVQDLHAVTPKRLLDLVRQAGCRGYRGGCRC